MNFNKKPVETASHKGVFLIFVVGLFLIQVVFAFTIHGDIGPQSAVIPDIQQAAPPVLIGRIDSVMSQPKIEQPVRPAPVAIMAPAQKPGLSPKPECESKSISKAKEPVHLKDAGNHYLEYQICKGDSLQSISRKIYGNTRMVSAIVRLNRLTSTKDLKWGEKLSVPKPVSAKK